MREVGDRPNVSLATEAWVARVQEFSQGGGGIGIAFGEGGFAALPDCGAGHLRSGLHI